jgi:glycosyltransferase involved in cell wall biosynthesis
MTLVPRVALTLTQTAHRVPGGTATSVLRLAEELVRTDEVELIGVVARGDLRRPGTLLRGGADPASASGLPDRMRTAALPLPVPVLYDSWARFGRPTVTSVTGPVDLVHVTVPMRVGLGAAPMVATVHDLFPLSRPDDFTERGARLMRDGLRWVLDEALEVMVPSTVVAEACAEHGVDPARVTVVPWGSDPVSVEPAQVAAVRRRHGLVGPYVLVVGTLEPRKNLAGVLSALALLDRPGLTLAVVGPQGWGTAPDPVECGLAGPVALLGHVPAADLPALYAGAQVVCFPSFEEGFGLPVLEAMAAGAPVVTSSTTATAEVAGDAAVLVDPHDPAGIAAGLARVIDDPDRAASLADAGRRRAAQHRWSDAAAATVAVYRRAMQR